ncbi:MAG TPA: acetyl-CoA carboxylase biotin carboxyl carrier protein [Kofleriaceae bacterium]|nr:acetyl-CoA carboxylase biotin carboxyl carrier protein [Kofleriaceae bacterium]
MASRGKSRAEDRRPEPADAAGPQFVAIARGLAEIVTEHNLSELILDTKDLTLTVRRGGAVAAPVHVVSAAPAAFAAGPAPAPSAGAAAEPPPVADKSHVVTSPFVGTFYRRPNPDSPNYVSLRDKVDKGQVLCIVEAMKLMNEIEADVAGTVVGILVEDGAPVEYGQALFKIAP